jgi:hypothetical protein
VVGSVEDSSVDPDVVDSPVVADSPDPVVVLVAATRAEVRLLFSLSISLNRLTLSCSTGVGHVAATCPSVAVAAAARGPRKCYSCQQEGHSASFFPLLFLFPSTNLPAPPVARDCPLAAAPVEAAAPLA